MLKFILIFIAVLYLIGFIGRLLFTYWVKKMARQAGFYQNSSSQYKKEGDVTVNVKPPTSKKFDKNDGDYIDFEEVK